MEKNAKIYVAGHQGMVGSAFIRRLRAEGYTNIITRTHAELDLCRQHQVETFFKEETPDYVILAAARVGGIMANINNPATFLYENLMIESNVIECAYKYNVKKLLFLGSSCIYPRSALQPMKEEYLLEGKVEPTNEGYAIAKIAGIKLCEMYNRQYGVDYISIMPCNLYGIGDNFDASKSHVVPGMIRKFHEAKIKGEKQIVVWGTGMARREFLFADDLIDGCMFLMDKYSGSEFINIGSGTDVTIRELAELIKEVVEYQGEIVFDTSKPDGMPQKLLDVKKLNDMGWKYKTDLREGLKKTYQWYVDNYKLLMEVSNG